MRISALDLVNQGLAWEKMLEAIGISLRCSPIRSPFPPLLLGSNILLPGPAGGGLIEERGAKETRKDTFEP
jgi:hypothetical protein